MRSGIRPRLAKYHRQLLSWLGIAGLTLTGCAGTEQKVSYIGNKPLTEYIDQTMRIAHPVLDSDAGDIRSFPYGPRTIKERLDAHETWDLGLSEAIHLALVNNKIVRSNDRGQDGRLQGNGGGFVPDSSASVYDPAIQETGVLFGARGIESALSAFDAQLTSRLNIGRTEIVQNNIFNGAGLPAGSTLQSDTAQFITGVQKQFGWGGTLALSHEIDYLQNNVPTALFPSNYTGNVAASLRQPLLAGAGSRYTRIAGPVGQNIQGLSGVNQGVVIARINNDISIADFEASVNNMIFDVEKLYWDLSLAYRQYDTSVANRKAGEKSWHDAKVKMEVGTGEGLAEAQARDAYFARKATEESSLARIDSLENNLRRMCGLPLNDGRILRPVDEPIIAQFKPDWNSDVAMALTRRVELRRQKWNIKSTELQLEAAKSFTKPRLDLVSNYQINGFGDRLMSDHAADGVTAEGFHNFYDALLRGHQTSYGTGFEFSMPFGFRAAQAQVRNLELRLAKSRMVLRAQEDDIIYQLAQTYQDLENYWANAQTYWNRRIAANEQALYTEQKRLQGKEGATLRDQLEAQAHLAEADAAFYGSVIEYTKTVAHVHYRKGTLLEMNNIYLAEGTWDPKAYEDALERAWQRTYSIEHPLQDIMTTEPEPFAADADPGTSSYGFDPNSPNGAVPLTPPANEVPAPGADVPAPPDGVPPPPVDGVPEGSGVAVPDPDALPNPNAVQPFDKPPEGPVADKPGRSKF